MVWSFVSAKRRKRLIADAARSRAEPLSVKIAWIAVLVYNCIGLIDIYSTWLGVESGAGEEINPLIRAAMDTLGPGWIAAKLALQGVISFMVLWFPHRVVLGIFIAAISFNAGIVYQNLVIAGFF